MQTDPHSSDLHATRRELLQGRVLARAWVKTVRATPTPFPRVRKTPTPLVPKISPKFKKQLEGVTGAPGVGAGVSEAGKSLTPDNTSGNGNEGVLA